MRPIGMLVFEAEPGDTIYDCAEEVVSCHKGERCILIFNDKALLVGEKDTRSDVCNRYFAKLNLSSPCPG